MFFIDRSDAGKKLAQALMSFKGQPAVVYGLPRGGVVLGAEVARALDAPLDLILVRKIGHPRFPEYAIGAVTDDGALKLNAEEAQTLNPTWIENIATQELREARRRRVLYLGDSPPRSVEGKVAIVVDDGLATGLTMEAAVGQLRKRHPKKIVIAVPVAAEETVERLRDTVDELVTLYIPPGEFGAVGAFYRNFEQVSDEDVVSLLKPQEPAP